MGKSLLSHVVINFEFSLTHKWQVGIPGKIGLVHEASGAWLRVMTFLNNKNLRLRGHKP